MKHQESRRHHFVPRFLLRPWLKDHLLHGYYWNHHRNRLECKRRGLNSFCRQIDLLTLNSHHLGRDALERIFFHSIDTKGADARDCLLHGPRRMSVDQRCDFARLLISLEIRRPSNIDRLKYLGNRAVKDFNEDHELLNAMRDRILTLVQKAVDNPEVGRRLINAKWQIKRLRLSDGTFVLADRPLYRSGAYDDPMMVWILPLTPRAAFVAANHPVNAARVARATPQRFAKAVNGWSSLQAERFVFSVESGHERWLTKRLKRRHSG